MLKFSDQSNLFFLCIGVLALASVILFFAFRSGRTGRGLASFCILAISASFSIALVEYFMPYVVYCNYLTCRQYMTYQSWDQFMLSKWRPSEKWRLVWPEFNVSVEINRQGMRGPSVPYERDPGRPRALMLGDSFTFGFGVEEHESYCGLIRAGIGRDWDVINSGVAGYGPHHELTFLLMEGYKYKPDAVFLFMNPGDLTDSVLLKDFAGAPLMDLLIARSAAVKSGYDYANAQPKRRLKTSNFRLAYNYLKKKAFIIDIFAPFEGARLDVFLKTPPKETKNLEKLNLEIIYNMKELCKMIGADFHIVMLPCWIQIHKEDWPKVMRAVQCQPADFDFDSPQRIMREFAEENGCPLFDLLPVFQERSKNSRLFFYHDDHTNADGHRVVAEAFLNKYGEYFETVKNSR